MEEQILVPLDGSSQAEIVLPHAIRIARATGRGVFLLRVVPSVAALELMAWPGATLITSPDLMEAELGTARAYLRGVEERLQDQGLAVDRAVRVGDPTTEILTCAHEVAGIAQIAMATHSRSAPGRWVFGSVAERVLQEAAVPLLLVPGRGAPPPAAIGPYRTILVPLDGSACAEHALDQAVRLARAMSAELLLVTVTPSPEEIARAGLASLRLLTEYEVEDHRVEVVLAAKVKELQGTGLRARFHVHHGVAAEEILAIREQEAVELIVMGTHGRRGWQRFWLGSVALQVVHGSVDPVLLVRSPAPA